MSAPTNSLEIVASVLDSHGEKFHEILSMAGVNDELYGLIIQFGEVCALAGGADAIEVIQQMWDEARS